MEIQCFHLALIKALVCLKKKGDARIKLTFRDRIHLVSNDNVKISISHIHKVLGDCASAPCSFSQYTMDELAKYVGFEDWNAFLRHYPIPADLPLHTGKVVGKALEKLMEKVYEAVKNFNPDFLKLNAK